MFLYAVSLGLAILISPPPRSMEGDARWYFFATTVSGVHRLTIDGDAIAQMNICEDLFAVGDGQGCATTSARRGVEGLEGRHRCSKPVSLAGYQTKKSEGGGSLPIFSTRPVNIVR